MSFCYIKSLSYKKDKVYASLAVNNLIPLKYDTCEIKKFTDYYVTFGKEEFEKWLIQDFILTGELNIKSYANKNLKRLDNVSKLINMDANYRMQESKYWELFDLSLKDNDKNKYKMEFESIYNDKKMIISNYYSRYKKLENGNEL